MVLAIITDERAINLWGAIFSGLLVIIVGLIVYIYTKDRADERDYRKEKDASIKSAFEGIENEIAGMRKDVREVISEIKDDYKILHEKVYNHETRISIIEKEKNGTT
jgi:hypothetical protein